MKCTSPNYIYFKDTDPENKRRVGFINGKNAVEYLEKHPEWLDGCIEVPCGNCTACRLDYSRTWANRCYLESLCHPFSWFITLTYRDECLVSGSKGYPTLEKNAISDFIRALRDKLGHQYNIRYFGCGEYGDGEGERVGFNPHHHIIVFGAPLTDLTIDMPDMSKPKLPSGKYPIFRRKNRDGDYVFFSQTIYDCWQKGKIEVEDATWNTAAYVSRYVVKKQKGRASDIYRRLGIYPEYVRMSTKPGIGANWMIYNKEKLLKNDYLSVKNAKGAQTSRPPRYFEKLMMKDPDSVDAAIMECNKLRRIYNAKVKTQEHSSNKSYKQLREDEAAAIDRKTKVFARGTL